MFKKLFSYFSQNDNDEITRKEEIEVFKDQIATPSAPKETIKFEERLKLRIENALSSYDFIKKEKISFLASELVNDNFKHSKDLLSLEEKRALKLNTRAKYARDFIDCFSDVEKLDFDPKFFCENLIYTERSILWSLDNLEELKGKKFIEKITLEKQIVSEEKEEWVKEIYNINELNEFEQIDYTEKRVLFSILPNIDIDNPLNRE
nr:MAG TPA: hypothetical protein [Caudoviricetes sp.]